MFRLALSQYPGPKWALTKMTEEQLALQDWVLATRINDGKKEYLLNLAWTTYNLAARHTEAAKVSALLRRVTP